MVMETIFEFSPVLLAMIALVMCGRSFKIQRRRFDKFKLMLSVIAALLLIIAQTSWYFSSVINQQLEDTWLANYIWTLFNILAMVLIILNAYPRKVKNDQINDH